MLTVCLHANTCGPDDGVERYHERGQEHNRRFPYSRHCCPDVVSLREFGCLGRGGRVSRSSNCRCVYDVPYLQDQVRCLALEGRHDFVQAGFGDVDKTGLVGPNSALLAVLLGGAAVLFT